VKLFGYIYYITTKLNYERTDNTQPHDWRKGQCRVSTLELAYRGFVDGNDQNRRGERQALLRHESDREMDKQPRSHGPAGTRARVSQLGHEKGRGNDARNLGGDSTDCTEEQEEIHT